MPSHTQSITLETMKKPIQNTPIIILGASGGLTEKKLIPALHTLYKKGEIDDTVAIIGSGRSDFSTEEFRSKFSIGKDFKAFLHYHRYIQGLRKFVTTLGNFDRFIFFFALPPSVYAGVTKEIYNEGFREDSNLIIEKPFGRDYESARELNKTLLTYYDESQLYRIDHYLAKEAVQNILVFRFGNLMFHPVWNSNYIESIQINGFEDEGVGKRSQYFDKTGIIRDMVQNHLLQMLALVTMDPPVSLEAEDIRVQKKNLLRAVELHSSTRLQYEGYRDTEGVDPESNTETYAELKLYINNYTWSGMPVYIRTGKALPRKGTEIGIRFKKIPRILFNKEDKLNPNIILFRIQPAEGIIVDLSSKIPGSDMGITTTQMNFCYRSSFQEEIPEAYQKLLLDALRGDQTLFVSSEETELAWKKIAPALDTADCGTYPQGSVPDSCLNVDWIDFDNYQASCS